VSVRYHTVPIAAFVHGLNAVKLTPTSVPGTEPTVVTAVLFDVTEHPPFTTITEYIAPKLNAAVVYLFEAVPLPSDVTEPFFIQRYALAGDAVTDNDVVLPEHIGSAAGAGWTEITGGADTTTDDTDDSADRHAAVTARTDADFVPAVALAYV
jgi:hypothetical protein